MTFEALYRENYPLVYGYLLSLCGDPAQAEDLAADTFLRAIQRAGSYRGDCKPSTWLCAIGKTLYLNQRRRDGRQLPLEAAPPPGGRAVEEAFCRSLEAPVDTSPSTICSATRPPRHTAMRSSNSFLDR